MAALSMKKAEKLPRGKQTAGKFVRHSSDAASVSSDSILHSEQTLTGVIDDNKNRISLNRDTKTFKLGSESDENL